MSASYEGNHNDYRGSNFHGTFIEAQHIHLPPHAVNWPIRIGVIPEKAAHYQHRAVADQIASALDSSGTVVLRQVLSGTGGVGKTQLAAHHARTLSNATSPDQKLDLLLWVNASTRGRITEAYSRAASALFPEPPNESESAAEFFLTWLRDPTKHQNRRWLIVWDDLDDPSTVDDLWPPHDQTNGHVLVTTRRRDNSLSTQERCLVEIGTYSDFEAHSFLTRAFKKNEIPYSTIALEKLSCDLGNLPLALSQAVAYMAELKISCEEYRGLFNDRMRTLKEVFPDWNTKSPVAATWDLSLEKADSYNPKGVARPLMGIISLLSDTGIPEEVLTAPASIEYLNNSRTTITKNKERGKGAQRILSRFLTLPSKSTGREIHSLRKNDIKSALAALARLSLINWSIPTTPEKREADGKEITRFVAAHKLVQRATREHRATRPTWNSIGATADALVGCWIDMQHNPQLNESLLENASALGETRTNRDSSEEGAIYSHVHPVLFWIGNGLWNAGRLDESYLHWKKVADISNTAKGIDDPDTLTAEANMATLLGQLNNPGEALQELEEVTRRRSAALGHTNQDTLTARYNLAIMREQINGPEQAEQELEQISREMREHLGRENRYTLLAKGSLERIKGETQNPSHAIQALEEVLSIQTRVLHPDHSDIYTTRSTIAQLKYRSGRIEEAAFDFRENRDHLLRLHGPTDRKTLEARSNYASMIATLGKLQEAEISYDGLAEDHCEEFGVEHPATLTVQHNLAIFLEKIGKNEQALNLLQEILTKRNRIIGPVHQETIETRINLANMRGRIENPNLAIGDLSFLVTQLEVRFGIHHPLTTATLANLEAWIVQSISHSRSKD